MLEKYFRSTSVFLSSLTDIERRQWDRLAESTSANFSLYPDWSEVVARSHGIVDMCELVQVSKGDRAIALFPIYIKSSTFLYLLKLKSLELVGNYVSYHNSLITVLEPRIALDHLVIECVQRGAAVVHLATIPNDSDLGVYLNCSEPNPRYWIHKVVGEVSPYLSLPGSWDELLATKPKKFRYKLRKRNELLENSTSLQLKWFTSKEDCSVLLDAMLMVERNSWKSNAGLSINDNEREKRYYELLLPVLASKNAMFANVLYVDGAPIAYNLCCFWCNWVGQMKTSFDVRYSELSPGLMVIDSAIKHSIAIGADEFDFLGDAAQHKLAWSKKSRAHSDYFVYVRSTMKGNFVGGLKKFRSELSKHLAAAINSRN